MNAWWSYALAPFGLAGLWMAGRRNRWGWALGIATQVLWLAYAVQTRQWGFIPGSAAYAAIYFRNWWTWRPREADLCQATERFAGAEYACALRRDHKKPVHQTTDGRLWTDTTREPR